MYYCDYHRIKQCHLRSDSCYSCTCSLSKMLLNWPSRGKKSLLRYSGDPEVRHREMNPAQGQTGEPWLSSFPLAGFLQFLSLKSHFKTVLSQLSRVVLTSGALEEGPCWGDMWEGNCWLSPSSWTTWKNTGMSTLRFAWLSLRQLVLNVFPAFLSSGILAQLFLPSLGILSAPEFENGTTNLQESVLLD